MKESARLLMAQLPDPYVSDPKPAEKYSMRKTFTVRKWQQRVLVPAEELIVVPPDADPQQAAMIAINPVTAALLLDQYVDLQPGDAVVYNAATSGLAQWLAALAGKRGVRTIGLVRRREDVERVKRGGCEIVVVDDEEIGAVQARLQGLN